MAFDVKFSESNSSFEAGFDIENTVTVVRNDHTILENRDAADQHPMSAITGLEEALGEKQPSGDYITEAELKTVTDETLAQAKASGQFDGHSPEVTATKTDGTTEIKVDGDTIAEINDGATPVRGTDYWTETDKAEIVDDVLEDGKTAKPFDVIEIDLSEYALPTVTADDNGKILRVTDGAWAAVELPSASGVSF